LGSEGLGVPVRKPTVTTGIALSATRTRAASTARAGSSYGRRGKYRLFIVPALVVTVAVIIFPWLYTVYMSLHEWKVGSPRVWVGLENYVELLNNRRFQEAVGRTFVFTAMAVVFPVLLGVIAAVFFHQEFPFRGVFRVIFMMPMIATPVAIALVWTMMFHPQLGVLNYLLTRVGLPASLWVYSPDTVIPSLVMIETWQWTPLVMLIVLGGLASLPTEPLESAVIDGANSFQIFRDITLPMILPFIMVAVVLRTIDALKAFDTIFAITQGGPGTASETINIYLYLQAFSFYRIGHASAVVVVFFGIIVACSLVMLYLRQKTRWT
jgi:multiple sugar transport system permease protein